MGADHRLSVTPFTQQQQPQRPHHEQLQASSMYQAHRQPNHSTTSLPVSSKQCTATQSSAVTALLPYCTVEAPLSNSQVIAVTDVVGSLQELVLLALRARAGDEEGLCRLENALGSEQVMAGLVEFFGDEFEVL
ncbi:hypothetical protein SVAN01_02440 [Stagonosporopsis vannaccii]|nr:hypothetical protein SVAN01_02440 [Stagonosporopsis vannaccii]